MEQEMSLENAPTPVTFSFPRLITRLEIMLQSFVNDFGESMEYYPVLQGVYSSLSSAINEFKGEVVGSQVDDEYSQDLEPDMGLGGDRKFIFPVFPLDAPVGKNNPGGEDSDLCGKRENSIGIKSRPPSPSFATSPTPHSLAATTTSPTLPEPSLPPSPAALPTRLPTPQPATPPSIPPADPSPEPNPEAQTTQNKEAQKPAKKTKNKRASDLSSESRPWPSKKPKRATTPKVVPLPTVPPLHPAEQIPPSGSGAEEETAPHLGDGEEVEEFDVLSPGDQSQINTEELKHHSPVMSPTQDDLSGLSRPPSIPAAQSPSITGVHPGRSNEQGVSESSNRQSNDIKSSVAADGLAGWRLQSGSALPHAEKKTCRKRGSHLTGESRALPSKKQKRSISPTPQPLYPAEQTPPSAPESNPLPSSSGPASRPSPAEPLLPFPAEPTQAASLDKPPHGPEVENLTAPVLGGEKRKLDSSSGVEGETEPHLGDVDSSPGDQSLSIDGLSVIPSSEGRQFMLEQIKEDIERIIPNDSDSQDSSEEEDPIPCNGTLDVIYTVADVEVDFENILEDLSGNATKLGEWEILRAKAYGLRRLANAIPKIKRAELYISGKVIERKLRKERATKENIEKLGKLLLGLGYPATKARLDYFKLVSKYPQLFRYEKVSVNWVRKNFETLKSEFESRKYEEIVKWFRRPFNQNIDLL